MLIFFNKNAEKKKSMYRVILFHKMNWSPNKKEKWSVSYKMLSIHKYMITVIYK